MKSMWHLEHSECSFLKPLSDLWYAISNVSFQGTELVSRVWKFKDIKHKT